jgi:hypothetical protein
MGQWLTEKEPRIPLKLIEDTLDADDATETFGATAMVYACLPQKNKTLCGMFVENQETGESVSVFFQLFNSEIKVHVSKGNEKITEVLLINEADILKFVSLAKKEKVEQTEPNKKSASDSKNPLLNMDNS